MRRLGVMVLILAAFALPAAARAADPLGLTCAGQGDGIRLCQGRIKTFDGVPLDANLALPAGSSLPLVVLSHGYGGSKLGYQDMKPWAQRGYAVLAFSARGFGESCGSPASRLTDPVGCAHGWVRLDDVRYDAPYGRASNGTFTVDVRSLELRLPVRERRGAQVRRPLAPVPGR